MEKTIIGCELVDEQHGGIREKCDKCGWTAHAIKYVFIQQGYDKEVTCPCCGNEFQVHIKV